MTPNPPSQTRILLLLIGSVIAGLLVASLLTNRMETRHNEPLPTEQPLVLEGP